MFVGLIKKWYIMRYNDTLKDYNLDIKFIINE